MTRASRHHREIEFSHSDYRSQITRVDFYGLRKRETIDDVHAFFRHRVLKGTTPKLTLQAVSLEMRDRRPRTLVNIGTETDPSIKLQGILSQALGAIGTEGLSKIAAEQLNMSSYDGDRFILADGTQLRSLVLLREFLNVDPIDLEIYSCALLRCNLAQGLRLIYGNTDLGAYLPYVDEFGAIRVIASARMLKQLIGLVQDKLGKKYSAARIRKALIATGLWRPEIMRPRACCPTTIFSP